MVKAFAVDASGIAAHAALDRHHEVQALAAHQVRPAFQAFRPDDRAGSAAGHRPHARKSVRRRDQTPAGGYYPTAAPAHDRVDPSYSRHRISARRPPDAVRPLQDHRPTDNLTDRPALDRRRPRLRRRCGSRQDLRPLLDGRYRCWRGGVLLRRLPTTWSTLYGAPKDLVREPPKRGTEVVLAAAPMPAAGQRSENQLARC
jgi:hypothetical protein